MQNKRRVGTEKEELAIAYLEEQGATILSRNFFFHGGEVDLIAWDGEYLCFIEVKYRSSRVTGNALEAIDARKAAQVRRVAQIYLYQKRYSETTPCRFDAAGVNGTTITYIKNAF